VKFDVGQGGGKEERRSGGKEETGRKKKEETSGGLMEEKKKRGERRKKKQGERIGCKAAHFERAGFRIYSFFFLLFQPPAFVFARQSYSPSI